MFSPIQRTIRFDFIFWIAAILVLIFALGVSWWAACLVVLLANVSASITYS